MPVNLHLDPAVPVAGVELVTLSCGIKKDKSPDLVVIRLAKTATSAGVFTKSLFSAAPVTISRDHLAHSQGKVRVLLINSGNANAGTGQEGIDMALEHCASVAEYLGVPEQSVMPFSTGVIGQLLPNEKMLAGISQAASELKENSCDSQEHWLSAAKGIMTTDTQPKATSRQITIDGKVVTITGMAKGAGMIQPNMATLLSYVFTDAVIPSEDLQPLLEEVVDMSFNAITVDSDTSTNDSLILSATGQGVALNSSHPDWANFKEALKAVCLNLAQGIIRDAEGASKFITVTVGSGASVAQCKRVAYSVANSPLVKTAMFASDANVGRLLMAIGKSGEENIDASKITVSLGDVVVFENAGIAHEYTEEKGTAVMMQPEIEVNIQLHIGTASASVYTSDLSHDYVSINADYRS